MSDNQKKRITNLVNENIRFIEKNRVKKNNYFVIFYYPKKIIFALIFFFKTHKDKIISVLIFVFFASTVGVILTHGTNTMIRYGTQKYLLSNLKTLEQPIIIENQNNSLIFSFPEIIREDVIVVSKSFVRYFLMRAGFYILTRNYILSWDHHTEDLLRLYTRSLIV